MQFDKHETDLYVLPDSKDEQIKIEQFLKSTKWGWHYSFADVIGNSWFNRSFIEIPFGIELKEKISSL